MHHPTYLRLFSSFDQGRWAGVRESGGLQIQYANSNCLYLVRDKPFSATIASVPG